MWGVFTRSGYLRFSPYFSEETAKGEMNTRLGDYVAPVGIVWHFPPRSKMEDE